MASAAEIADLITQGMQGPTGAEDAAFHTGVIRSWDRQSGTNVVIINGVEISNLKALQGGIGIYYSPGDVVIIIRKQRQYFIMGKVAAPGGAAGSGVQFVTSNVSDHVNNTSYVDLPSGPGPSVSAYIGSSKSAIVIWQCTVSANNAKGQIAFQVSGASSIAPGAFTGMSVWHTNRTFNQSGSMSVTTEATLTGAYTIGPGAGLQTGLNTFQLKYRTDNFNAGAGADFSQPGLTVIPL